MLLWLFLLLLLLSSSSSSVTERDVRASLDVGMVGHLGKPFRRAELREAIARAIDGASPSPSGIPA